MSDKHDDVDSMAAWTNDETNAAMIRCLLKAEESRVFVNDPGAFYHSEECVRTSWRHRMWTFSATGPRKTIARLRCVVGDIFAQRSPS